MEGSAEGSAADREQGRTTTTIITRRRALDSRFPPSKNWSSLSAATKVYPPEAIAEAEPLPEVVTAAGAE